jgi:hypothetical protein
VQRQHLLRPFLEPIYLPPLVQLLISLVLVELIPLVLIILLVAPGPLFQIQLLQLLQQQSYLLLELVHRQSQHQQKLQQW